MKQFSKSFAKILGFLTAISFFFIIVAILTSFIKDSNKDFFSNYADIDSNNESSNIIAILNLSGPIISEPKNDISNQFFSTFEAIYPSLIKNYLIELESKKISGLIVSINSPGGSVSASKKVYNLLDNFKKNNNVLIYFHTSDILASGGYWVSMSGDKIFAEYGSIIGSIGVKGPDWIYYNTPNSLSTGILGNSVESKNGIELYSNTAGIYKDIFNPFRKPSQKEINTLQKIVDSIYEDFVNIVSSKRKIEGDEIKNKIGAMIYNTNMAIDNHLIDGEKEISEIIKIMNRALKIESSKIITNNNKDKFNFFNSFLLSSIFKKNSYEENNSIIKNKFCNNLRNELSSVSLGTHRYGC